MIIDEISDLLVKHIEKTGRFFSNNTGHEIHVSPATYDQLQKEVKKFGNHGFGSESVQLITVGGPVSINVNYAIPTNAVLLKNSTNIVDLQTEGFWLLGEEIPKDVYSAIRLLLKNFSCKKGQIEAILLSWGFTHMAVVNALATLMDTGELDRTAIVNGNFYLTNVKTPKLKPLNSMSRKDAEWNF